MVPGWLDRRDRGTRRARLAFGWLCALVLTTCGDESATIETVTFPSADGLVVTADLYRGAGPDAATVLLFHQSQSSRGEFLRVAPRLQALGYNALAVDLRWGGAREGVNNETAARHGTPELIPRIEAGSERAWPTIDASYDDMVAALHWLDAEGYTGSRFALGSSFSAMLVYRLGAEEDLGGVLAFSPAEYDDERPTLVRSWAHALHAPALSFAPLGEEEMVAEVAAEVSVDGSLAAVGSMEGHGASVLDQDPVAWRSAASFLGQHSGGPPGRATYRLPSPDGVPVVLDRYEGEGTAVLALFHQGGGSARGEYGFLIPRLLEAGYDVVAADLQGGGDRFGFPNRTLAETPEGGDFTYCDALPQLTTVLDSMAMWYPDVPRLAWGSSYSGALVLHVAAAGADVAGVLAFSPASGGPMGDCSANLVAGSVDVPLLLVRPDGEAAIPSVRQQLALFGSAGHAAVVVSPGVHGSSTLNPVRVQGVTDGTWEMVEAFLGEALSDRGAGARENPTPAERSVLTDGVVDDWGAGPPSAIDAVGDVPPGAPVDLRRAWARMDDRFLHLLVDVGRPVTLQGSRGSTELVIDADGDVETGVGEEPDQGAEAVIVFSRPGGFAPGVGFGVGIRRVVDGALQPVEPGGRAGILASPTHSSTVFEIRLDRSMDLGGSGTLASDSGLAAVTVRFTGPDGPVDRIGPVVVPMVPRAEVGPALLEAAALEKATDDLRVAVWNVSDGQFHARAAAFQRVLGALSPDVVLLDEVPADATEEGLETFFTGVGAGGDWNWWLAEGGGVQRTVVASPRYDVEPEPRLARVEYPAGALDRWVADTDSAEFAVGRATVEADAGLSTTGAWIESEGRRILLVPVDLQSAGFDGSPRDRLRELQAGVLRDAVARVLSDEPEAGLVIGGDFNLVGSIRPLEALVRGLEVGGGDLALARALNTRDRSLITWRSLGNADDFSPGRLDFVAYRSGALDVTRAFVFDVEDYGAEARASLGLVGGETAETSDHLPVVVDFRPRR